MGKIIVPPSEGLQKLFEVFKQSGFNLYHVGGSVRDMLLGREPKDFDLTTDAKPEETKEVLEKAGYKTFPLGEAFGTISAHVGDQIIEITTHRRDVTRGRHPDVAFTKDLNEDLSRRDLTVNSIAMNGEGNLIDPFNGAKDIARKVIRTTGAPMDRFGEDPLRMLRAVRFASQLGFKVDGKTKKAIHTSAQAILSVSRERWLEEMNKLLLGAYVGAGLELLKQTRLLGYVLPEVFPIVMSQEGELPSKYLWHHTKVVVTKSKPEIIVRWAALLHDIAKPQTRQEIIVSKTGVKIKETSDPKALAEKMGGEVHFYGHEQLGAELVDSIGRRLHMSNDMRQSIKGLVALHQRVGDCVSRKNDPPVSASALRRVARDCEDLHCRVEDLIELFAADSSSARADVKERQAAHAELLREAVGKMREEELRPKLPSGIGLEIMKRFALKPGPQVGELKQKLDDWLVSGEIDLEMSMKEMLDRLEINE